MTLPEQAQPVARALASGVRWIVWRSEDERACRADLERIAQHDARELRLWSLDTDPHAYVAFEDALTQALQQGAQQAASLWVWLDFDPPAALAPRLTRKLRSLAQRRGPVACVFIQYTDPPSPRPPERVHLDRPSPSLAELESHIVNRCLAADCPFPAQIQDTLHKERAALARHCAGLEHWQVDVALSMAADPTRETPAQRLAAIEQYKAVALGASQYVEPCSVRPGAALGGLDRYRSWLAGQALAMTDAARQAGVLAPRGVLLAGVPGCGKSLAARVTAHQLNLPLYRIDLGRLFTGVLGGSEANMRRTLRLCERLAPAVLWIDEIEKGIVSGSGQSDGGTALRSLATFMTWLQEHESPVFLVATANRIDTLPAELTRRGRLDEVFFVDLPNLAERSAILDVYGVQHWPLNADVRAQALEQSEGLSGAELCAAVSTARLLALSSHRSVGWTDLLRAIEETIPLSQARPAQIEALRRWGSLHARPAGDPTP